MRHLIIQNSIFVKSGDQIVSSYWSHDFMFLFFGVFEFRSIVYDKNKKSCNQNGETIWSHDLAKIEF